MKSRYWRLAAGVVMLLGLFVVLPHSSRVAHATPSLYSGDWPHSVAYMANEGWVNTDLPSSNYDAATIDMTWANVEPSSGTFILNWTAYTDTYDTELADLHSAGKKAIIVLWYLQDTVNSCSITAQAAPRYVWDDLGVSQYGCYTDSNSKSLLLPNYRASSFITDWQN